MREQPLLASPRATPQTPVSGSGRRRCQGSSKDRSSSTQTVPERSDANVAPFIEALLEDVCSSPMDMAAYGTRPFSPHATLPACVQMDLIQPSGPCSPGEGFSSDPSPATLPQKDSRHAAASSSSPHMGLLSVLRSLSNADEVRNNFSLSF